MLQSSSRKNPLTGRSARADETASSLPRTADETRGRSNLATTPRAGNISTDARAGRPG